MNNHEYDCWDWQGGAPRELIKAANSWEARKGYAAKHKIPPHDVIARRLEARPQSRVKYLD
jgi:hypothetical protein